MALLSRDDLEQHDTEGIDVGTFGKRVGGELFSDAMGKDGTYEGIYVGMIDHNVTLIARALGGDAPREGFSGRLAMMK